MDRSSSVCARVSTGVVETSIGRTTTACGKFSTGIVRTLMGRSPPVCGRALTDVVGTSIGRTTSVRAVYTFFKAAILWPSVSTNPINGLRRNILIIKLITTFSLQRKAYPCLWTSLVLEEVSARIVCHSLTD
jgi:hypothetical protein